MRHIALGVLGLSSSTLLIAAAACSSGNSENASAPNQSPIVINPEASENESHLVLQLPTDACLPGTSCTKVLGFGPNVFVDGSSVALGASTRLKPGVHNVAVNGVGWQVTTTADSTTTVTLPVVDEKCTDATLPGVPATDFGGSVSVSNAPCPTTASGSATGVPSVPAGNGYIYYTANGGTISEWAAASSANVCANATAGNYSFYYYTNGYIGTGAGAAGCSNALSGASQPATVPGTARLTSAFEAFPPGTLSATVNGSAQTLSVNAGDEVDFNITLPALGSVPPTFATNITFLSARENADAAHATITSSCSGDRSYTFPAPTVGSTAIPSALNLNAFVNSSCIYTLNAGGRTLTLGQSAANNLNLNRVDVNNVTITREDGSTYTATGTWTLNYGGVQVAGPYSTGTGIDVLPGTYEFSLSYTDFDGPQTQTQTLTL